MRKAEQIQHYPTIKMITFCTNLWL